MTGGSAGGDGEPGDDGKLDGDGDGKRFMDGQRSGYRVPVVSLVLMGVFLVGGSVGLVVEWPAGPGNLDWGVWTVVYGGYLYVVAAALFHARTGR